MTEDKKRMTKKLKTNGEVIAAIKRGYGKTVKYDQFRFTGEDKSESHPCGTACCMFGAIAANYGGIAHGAVSRQIQMIIGEKIVSKWSNAFSQFTSESAFREMKKFLTEKQYEEITTFLMKRIK
jgi:hypothetical protein